MNLQAPSYPRLIIHVVVEPCDLVDAALESTAGTPAGRALMVVAFTLMHLHGDPDDRTEERIATIAPLFDVLLDQEESRASEEVRTLWAYVVDVFEPGSAVRELLVNAVSPRAREVYASVVEELAAAAEAAGPADDEDDEYEDDDAYEDDGDEDDDDDDDDDDDELDGHDA